ncbi:mannosyltransferase putative-domain-containing protein [Scheffersomyces xylosifermentans]|uniref:mannosyltransferase putative-domain-containing protein n=1 Tax=Scheffersomyces xylosifermentans TaxID=1304137 RepID=UPI00315DBD4C
MHRTMITSGRLSSPLPALLVVMIVIITVVNLYLLSYDNEDPIPVTGSGGETYVTGGRKNSRLQTEIDRVDDKEYVQGLVKELTKSKQKELEEQLKLKIEKENKDKFLVSLNNDIRVKYTAEMKELLKKEITEQYTRKYFKEMKLSYSLFNELKSQYYHDYYTNIKQFDFLKLFRETGLPEVSLPDDFPQKFDEALDRILNKQEYYSTIIREFLVENKPKCDALSNNEKGKPIRFALVNDIPDQPLSQKTLLEGANLPVEKSKPLAAGHDALVKTLKNLEEPPMEFNHGHGILITGGGKDIGAALVSIFQLRNEGSKLPIELILNTEEEFDTQICDELLPVKFNAKCLVMERELGPELWEELKLQPQQLRAFAILYSSFNHMIVLDPHNLAIRNIDNLLFSEPYLTTGFMLWPHSVQRQTSPLFYDIAQLERGEIVRRTGIANDESWVDYLQKDQDTEVAFHDFSGVPSAISTDGGQFALSKRRHFKSILLAVYYNLYGPDYYYPLLYQGAPDQGDRETWVAALEVIGEPYHLVENEMAFIGSDKNHNDKIANLVSDPRDNLDFFKAWKKYIREQLKFDTRLNPYEVSGFTQTLRNKFGEYHRKLIPEDKVNDVTGKIETIHRQEVFEMPKVLFMNPTKFKIDPFENFRTASDEESDIFSQRQLNSPGSTYKRLGIVDWELRFHTISKWFACLSITSEEFWTKQELDKKDVCDKITAYVELLKKDTKDKDTEELDYYQEMEKILKNIDDENRRQKKVRRKKETKKKSTKRKMTKRKMTKKKIKTTAKKRKRIAKIIKKPKMPKKRSSNLFFHSHRIPLSFS